MRNTSALVYLEFSPLSSAEYTVQSYLNNDDIGNPQNLVTMVSRTIQNEYFATLEKNIFLLDGTTRIAEPSRRPFGYFGNTLSDDEGNINLQNFNNDLSNTMSFNIQLTKPIRLSGITLDFGDIRNICSGVAKITSSAGEETIQVIPHTIEHRIIFENTENIRNITFTFTHTKFPNMYPRMIDIYLGISYTYTEENITSLTFNEEISPISSVLPVNTAEASVYFDGIDFDIFNTSKYFPSPKENVYSDVICIINDKQILLSKLKLDSIESASKHEVKFKFVSLTKELETTNCNFDCVYEAPLYWFINFILKGKYSVGILRNFDISEKKAIYFKNGITRDIFQQLLFVYGLMVNDSRGRFVISKLDRKNISNIIYPSSIIDDVKLTKINPPNIITVDTYDYNLQPSILSKQTYTKVYDGNILDEIHVTFEKPASVFRYSLKNKISGKYLISPNTLKLIQTKDKYGKYHDSYRATNPDGVVEEQWSYNYFGHGYGEYLAYTFHPLRTAGINLAFYYITIELSYYIENKSQYTLSVADGKSSNLLHIDKPQIFSSKNNVEPFAKNTLDYYKDIDLKIECSYIFDGHTTVGDTVYMYIDKYSAVVATVVKQSIDVYGGCISKITCVANSEPVQINYFMTEDGNDAMYMDDNSLI